MKKSMTQERDMTKRIVSDFGKQKLIMYANSFRNLARTYKDVNRDMDSKEDRQDYIVKQKLYENREVLAGQIKEMADVLNAVADENITVRELSKSQEKFLSQVLKRNKLVMDRFCFIGNQPESLEISINLKYTGKSNFLTSKVAKILSVVLEHDFIQKESSPLYVMDEFSNFGFVLKPIFRVETGVSKAVKETEKISGDSYGFLEDEKGKFSILLSDGMGSGDKAMADSELVIELAERFLEIGYPLDKTAKLINNTLITNVENQNMSTLDVCDINLHTGHCTFLKVGATVSFIKRANYVEKISAGNLPLGIFANTEPETKMYSLKADDYLVMISDGILEGLGQVIGEEGFYDFLCAMDSLSAKEMANHLLNYVIRVCNGKIKDDMTILVTKIIDF